MILTPHPNNPNVYNRTKKLEKIVSRGTFYGMYDYGKKILPEIAQSLLDKNKTGHLYVHYINGRKVLHRASAPGEPPANLTGRLRRSLRYQINKNGDQMVIGAGGKIDGKKVDYARDLEYGSIRIKPRPYFRPAFKKNHKTMIEQVGYRIFEQAHK